MYWSIKFIFLMIYNECNEVLVDILRSWPWKSDALSADANMWDKQIDTILGVVRYFVSDQCYFIWSIFSLWPN